MTAALLHFAADSEPLRASGIGEDQLIIATGSVFEVTSVRVAWMDGDRDELLFSANFACPVCGYSIEELEPRLFSFNSKHGWCTACYGTGLVVAINPTVLLQSSHCVHASFALDHVELLEMGWDLTELLGGYHGGWSGTLGVPFVMLVHTAAERSLAKTPPKWTVPAHTWLAMWQRTLLPQDSQMNAKCKSPMLSAFPSLYPWLSVPAEPAKCPMMS